MRRHISLAIFIIATFFGLTPSIARSQSALNCQSERSQREFNECALQRRKAADLKMNEAYQEQLTYLSTTQKERLRYSQRAWITYRDKACFYEAGPRAESGSIWPQQISDCEVRLTKQRTEILSMYVHCRENGCPY